jgi:hypothetical protein
MVPFKLPSLIASLRLGLGVIVGANTIAHISGANVSSVVPDAVIDVSQIRLALQDYANKHEGAYPDGTTSTEVFQRLIDDRDIVPHWLFFDLPGKASANSNRLTAKNVCFDFTRGVDSRGPKWLPIVIPTGYSIDYRTGNATPLPSNAITDKKIEIAYPDTTRLFSIFTASGLRLNRLKIMSEKPPGANTSKFLQLTPDGHL